MFENRTYVPGRTRPEVFAGGGLETQVHHSLYGLGERREDFLGTRPREAVSFEEI